MNNKLKFFIPLISLVLLMFGFEYSAPLTPSESCNLLLKAVDKPLVQIKLNEIATKLSKRQSIKTIFSQSSGYLKYDFIEDNLNIDWSILNMNKAGAGISFLGLNINYQDLTKSKIESILLGTGRVFVLVDVNRNGILEGEFSIFRPDEIKGKIDNLTIVCRSNNYSNNIKE